MKNIAKLFGIAIIMVIVFLFAACVAPPPPAPAPAPQPVDEPAPPPPPPPPPPPAPAARTTLILDGARNHTVKSGDTLVEIAKQYYNDGHYYPVIHLANNHLIEDADWIEPGTELIIPDLPRNLNDSGARAVVKQSLMNNVPFEHSRSRSATADGIRELHDSL